VELIVYILKNSVKSQIYLNPIFVANIQIFLTKLSFINVIFIFFQVTINSII